jgi:hypothetical protein
MKTKIEEMARQHRPNISNPSMRIFCEEFFMDGYNAAIQEASKDFDEWSYVEDSENIMTLKDAWLSSRLSAAKELAELREEIKVILEAVEYALAQRNQTYGMPESQAQIFRLRKIFSLLDEVIEKPSRLTPRLKERDE